MNVCPACTAAVEALPADMQILVFSVTIDTGSSDLWVLKPGTNATTTNTTDVDVDVNYGDGSGFSGVVAFANLSIGQFTVPSQGEWHSGLPLMRTHVTTR